MTYFTTSEAGFDLIRRFEGCEKKRPDGMIEAYKIGDDPVTIGWGQTGKMPDGRAVKAGLVISQQEADDALQFFVRNVVEPLVRKHFVCQTQAEFDACVSWTYNVRHDKLEAGQYSLPQLVNLKARDSEALVNKWLEYVATPGFENGLYKRRIAEVLMFLGLPWSAPAVWGYIASAVYKKNGVVNPTPFDFILSIAEKAAEAVKPVPAPPPPATPKTPPAAKPATPAPDNPAIGTKPASPNTKKPATPAPDNPAIGTKPASPNTKKPEEVPYRIDPNAGLKPLEESERAHGFFWQQFAVLILRLTGLGTFGTGAAQVANVVQSDAALSGALFNLTIPVLVLVSGVVISFVVKQYGDWKRARGERNATQGIY